MTKYEVAKLVDWAGTVNTRKKMQKVAYLLKAIGFPLNASFQLHHFGPYSRELAETLDELVQLQILKEQEVSNFAGRQFNYSLGERAKNRLTEFERSQQGRRSVRKIAAFRKTALSLIKKDVKELEIAATIVYFWRRERNWDKAVARTCRFKGLSPDEEIVERSATTATSLSK